MVPTALHLRVTELLCCPAMLYFLQRYSPHTDARKRACITSGITKPFRDSGQNGRIVYLTIHAGNSMAECSEQRCCNGITLNLDDSGVGNVDLLLCTSRSLPKGLLTSLG